MNTNQRSSSDIVGNSTVFDGAPSDYAACLDGKPSVVERDRLDRTESQTSSRDVGVQAVASRTFDPRVTEDEMLGRTLVLDLSKATIEQLDAMIYGEHSPWLLPHLHFCQGGSFADPNCTKCDTAKAFRRQS